MWDPVDTVRRKEERVGGEKDNNALVKRVPMGVVRFQASSKARARGCSLAK